MRSDEPTCAKCRHLLTESGVAACRLYHAPLEPCEDYKDISYRKPPIYGGITGIKDWGAK